jgi:MFS family permease
VFAISSVLGPLLGGAISDNATWRWVFWIKCALFYSFKRAYGTC